MANSAFGYQLAQQGVNLSGANALTPTAAVQAKTKTIPKVLRYPLKQLSNSTDYLQVKVVKYIAPGYKPAQKRSFNLASGTDLLKSSGNIENPLCYINLPMPSGLEDSNSVDWGKDSINAIEAYGVGAFQKMLGSGNLGQAVLGALQQAGADISKLSTTGAQDLVQQFFAGKLVNALGGNVNAETLLSRATGQVLNPNMELLFQAVNLRNFSFTFDFAPREPAESQMVKNIIRTFKQSMAAKTTNSSGQSLGAGLFISAPDVFQLTFKTGAQDHPFLYKMKPCALTGMGVNYNASGPYATYADATPVHMQMTLSFTELNPVYAEDYNTVGGVGY